MTFKTCYFTISILVCCLCFLTNAKKVQNAKLIKEAAFKCVSGERYQENKCNFCECKNGALVACSRTTCDDLPFYDMAKTCTIGTKWNEECNSCSCTKQYGTVCTIKPCGFKRSKAKSRYITEYLNKKKKRDKVQRDRISKARAKVVKSR